MKYISKIVVWENVPGFLSSDGGRAMGSFLGALAELGYGYAYRVLDAQYVRVDGFGRAVPQRRRRLFIVGYLGDWRRAAAVLFDSESLSGNPAPSREKGEGTSRSVAPSLTNSGRGVERTGDTRGQDPVVACWWDGGQVSQTLDAVLSKGQCMPEKNRFPAVLHPTYGIPGNWIGRKPENGGNAVEPMHNLSPNLTSTDRHAVAFDARQSDVVQYGEKTGSLDTSGHIMGVRQAMQVRRLTPRECERLMGYPDDYTLIPHNGKPAADGPRYKALGNSMAVNVMRWIGQRIQIVSKLEDAA